MANKLSGLENPYRSRGNWYKGAFHFHSTGSDGMLSPRASVQKYASAGFKVIGLSDHGRVTPVDPAWFPGILLIPTAEIGWPHMLHIGAKKTGKLDINSFDKAAALNRREKGFNVLCHPDWSNHTWKELDRAAPKVCALEVYNHVTVIENSTGTARETWDLLLRAGHRLWGFADDDSHFNVSYPQYAGGWVMIRSGRLERNSVLNSLKKGSYYSSQGPRLFDLAVEGKYIRLRCSPVVEVRAIASGVGAGKCFFSKKPCGSWLLDRSRFQWRDTTYIRIELVDSRGKVAWLNPLFTRKK
jgi:hypothetical protein